MVNIPDEDEDKDCKHVRREIMAQFIGECVVPISGKNYTKSWCRQNKGHCFLEKIIMSCLGYYLTVSKDKGEVPEEQYLIEDRLNTIEDWNLYKQYRKTPRSASEDDKQKFDVAAKNNCTLKKV